MFEISSFNDIVNFIVIKNVPRNNSVTRKNLICGYKINMTLWFLFIFFLYFLTNSIIYCFLFQMDLNFVLQLTMDVI